MYFVQSIFLLKACCELHVRYLAPKHFARRSAVGQNQSGSKRYSFGSLADLPYCFGSNTNWSFNYCPAQSKTSSGSSSRCKNSAKTNKRNQACKKHLDYRWVLFNSELSCVISDILSSNNELDLQTYNHYSWSETLAFLNSCSNPFICCWKNRQIRQKVRALLKKVFCWISDSREDNQ